MSVTLDATIGGTGSNSYQDAEAVQAILDGVRNIDAWTAIKNDDDKDIICVESTTLLEVMAYLGQKVRTAQALTWPRYGVPDPDYGEVGDLHSDFSLGNAVAGYYLDSATIPKRMLRAHAMLSLEIARAGQNDVWGVDTTANVIEKTVDVITTKYSDVARRKVGLRKFPSVWREIVPLLRVSRQQSAERA